MLTQFRTTLTKTAILSFALIVTISTAWAAISHIDTDDGIILTHLETAPKIPSDTPNGDLFVKKPPKDDGDGDGGGSEGPTTHYASRVFQRGEGIASFKVAGKGKNWIEFLVRADALDNYFDEQGIDSVEITAQLIEEWVDTDGGYYCLDFTFGPSGTHFEPEAELTLKGKYASPNTNIMLYDENGEALPVQRYNSADKIIFLIPHFSSYYYDDYNY